jgi:hypothetical protein
MCQIFLSVHGAFRGALCVVRQDKAQGLGFAHSQQSKINEIGRFLKYSNCLNPTTFGFVFLAQVTEGCKWMSGNFDQRHSLRWNDALSLVLLTRFDTLWKVSRHPRPRTKYTRHCAHRNENSSAKIAMKLVVIGHQCNEIYLISFWQLNQDFVVDVLPLILSIPPSIWSNCVGP